MAIRKKFIDVEIPMINESVSVLGTPESLHKKTIKLDMSRKLRGKNLEITFEIFNQDNQLKAFPKKMIIMKAYIRRATRKGTSYVEESFETKCADIRARVKPLLITRKKVSRVVRKNLRNTTKEWLINYAKEKNYIFICEEILSGELQRALLPKLKKIYPLAFCDIRIFETRELEKADFGKKAKEVKVEEKEKKEIIETEAKIKEEKVKEEKPKTKKKEVVKKEKEKSPKKSKPIKK